MLRLKSLAGILLFAFCSLSIADDGVLFSLPKQTTFNAGSVVSGAKVFFYADGTTTKQAIYSDPALTTPLSNPVEADAYGKLPAIFLNPALGEYKIVIAPADDTDPPSSPYETVDDYPPGLSAGAIGSALYPISAAELAAGLTAADLSLRFEYGDVRRFKSVLNGTADDTTALQNWLTVGGDLSGFTGTARVTAGLTIPNDDTFIDCRGMKILHDTNEESAVLLAEERDNVHIQNCEIDGKKSEKSSVSVFRAYGVHIKESTNSGIRDSYVHDAYEHCIRVGLITSGEEESANNYVINNRVEDCGQSTNSRGWGIWTFGKVNGITIAENRLKGNYAGGIMVDDVSSGASPGLDNENIVIDGNLVLAPSSPELSLSRGIAVNGALYYSATGNVVKGYRSGFGSAAGQANTLTGDGVVSGNYFSGLTDGARLVDSVSVLFEGNIVVMAVESDVDRAGIDIYSDPQNSGTNVTKNVSIKDNDVFSAAVGIRHGLNSSHDTTSTSLYIKGNDVFYIGSDATASTNIKGIHVDDVTDSEITGNTVVGFHDGIYYGADTAAYVLSNNVFDSYRYGIRLGTSGDYAARNITRDNGTVGLFVETAANAAGTVIKDNDLFDGIGGTFKLTTRKNNHGTANDIATGTYTLDTIAPVTEINSAGGAVTGTLGSGPWIGFVKTIVMTNATASSTVTVTNHATTDGEVGTFAAVDAVWIMIWTGTEWANITSDNVSGL